MIKKIGQDAPSPGHAASKPAGHLQGRLRREVKLIQKDQFSFRKFRLMMRKN